MPNTKPLTFADIKPNEFYVVLACCINSGVLDMLLVKTTGKKGPDMRALLQRPPIYNGTNFFRPLYALADIGAPPNGRQSSKLHWRVFDVADAEVLSGFVKRQDKAEYFKHIGVK